MEWPSGAAVGDVVIVAQDPSAGSRFVLHGSHGAQRACSTYAEAEAQAASDAERARANVWYVERGRLQLVCSFSNCPSRQETPAPDSHQTNTEAGAGDGPKR
jgi:hypothetical protein